MDDSSTNFLLRGDELSPPHLLPKAKNVTSSRLEFSGKPILAGRHPNKQRMRRVSHISYFIHLTLISMIPCIQRVLLDS